MYNIMLIFFISFQTFAYEANVYDDFDKKESTFEIIDDCGKVNKLTVKFKDIEKAINWQNKLFESKTFCIKSVDNNTKADTIKK